MCAAQGVPLELSSHISPSHHSRASQSTELNFLYFITGSQLLFSHSVMSDSLHGLQHASLHRPSLFPGVCSNSHPLNQWCHPQSQLLSPPSPLSLNLSPHRGPFQWVGTSGQSIGASASASVLPMYTQGWFPLGLTCFISLQSKGLSQESYPAPQFENINSSANSSAQPSLWSNSHIHTWLLEKP